MPRRGTDLTHAIESHEGVIALTARDPALEGTSMPTRPLAFENGSIRLVVRHARWLTGRASGAPYPIRGISAVGHQLSDALV